MTLYKYLNKLINENISSGSFSSLAGAGGMPADGNLTPSNYIGTNTPKKKKKKKKLKIQQYKIPINF